MRSILPKILFYYSAVASLLITTSLFFALQETGPVIFTVLFLPVTSYFILDFFKKLRLAFAKKSSENLNPYSAFKSGGMGFERALQKILIYYNFVITGLMVIFGFISATSVVQLIVAFFFFPLFIYFVVQVFPKRTKAAHLPTSANSTVLFENPNKMDKEVVKLKKEGVDIDRRAFLKLIGTAGMSLFLFSMFTKKAEAAFFGSVPGPGTVSIKDASGNKIDPAEKHPTDGYKITDVDDATPSYYGFVNKDGAWFIQKEGASGDYRYTKGSSDYTSNWDDRGTLVYDYFDNIF